MCGQNGTLKCPAGESLSGLDLGTEITRSGIWGNLRCLGKSVIAGRDRMILTRVQNWLSFRHSVNAPPAKVGGIFS